MLCNKSITFQVCCLILWGIWRLVYVGCQTYLSWNLYIIQDIINQNYNIFYMQGQQLTEEKVTATEQTTAITQEQPKQVTFSNVPQLFLSSSNIRVRKLWMAAKQGERLDIDKINVQSLDYPIKLTGNNFCSRFFTPEIQSYYVCNQCSLNNGDFTTMCYCASCFEPERHVGHSYTTQISYSDRAYCDCGRLERFKKQSFCSKHQNYKVEMKCQIPEEIRKQYIQTFTILIQMGIYCSDWKYLNRIIKYLQKLNENSIYYNRLTFGVFSQKTTYGQYKNEPLFITLAKLGCNTEKIMIHMGGDIRTRIYMIKLICSQCKEENYYDPLAIFTIRSLHELFNITAVEKLIQKNYYHDAVLRMVKDQISFSKHSPEILKKLMQIKYLSVSSLEEISKLHIRNQSISSSLSLKIFNKILELYPSVEQIKKMLTGQAFVDSSNPCVDIQPIKNKYQSQLNLPEHIRICHRMSGVLLNCILSANQEKARNFRQFLIENGVEKDKLEHFIHFAIISFKKLGYQEQQNQLSPLIPFLLLIKDSPSRSELIQRFWTQILTNQNQESQFKIYQLVDVFYFVLSRLYNADICLLIQRKKVEKSQKKQKLKYTQQENDLLKNWFRSFLSERQLISRDQLVHLRSQGILAFEEAGKVLNEVCSYNQQNQTFTYSTAQAGKNYVSKFPFTQTRPNFSGIYTSTFKFGQQIIPLKGSLAEILIDEVMKSQILFGIIDTEWRKSFQKEAYKLNGQKYTFLYFFALVLIDGLTKGKNAEAKQILQEVKSNEQKISSYTTNQEQIQKIKKLLGIQKKAEVKIQQKQESGSVKKKISEDKKKKILEKYHHKQELMLVRGLSQGDGKINEDEQLCILCHEREKPSVGFSLVYLTSIAKNTTICSAFHGKNNVANTFVSTCFHAVHIKCYTNLIKDQSSSQISCPLCQASSNCILPINYSKENRKLNRVCRNVLITHMVGQEHSFDIQTDFLLIFKHLVESKGLNSILYETRYEQKKKSWLKTDEYLFNVMERIFENSSKEDQAEHLAEIGQFEKQINACENQDCKIIQLLFTEALKSLLQHEESNEKFVAMLTQIRKAIKEDEYIIVYQQLCRLLSRQIQLPQQSEQEKKVAKKSLSFTLVRLPEKASEFIAKYNNKLCDSCQQRFDYVCLLCGKFFCQGCNYTHTSGAHNNTTICLKKSNLKIECHRKGFHSRSDVYENDFKVPFSEKSEDDDQVGVISEDYQLNEIIFQKIVTRFMEH